MTASDTRTAILDAGERLFAERGLYGASLIEVGRAANQQNRSAIQYHFGSREALVEAIATRHLANANQRRAELLHALDLTGRGRDFRSLVEALVLPTFLQLEALRSYYFRFLLQWSFGVLTARAVDALLSQPNATAFVEVLSRIDDQLGEVSPAVRQFRYRNGLFIVVRTLAEYETILADGGELDHRFAIATLVDMVAGMLGAPDQTVVAAQ
jgi:AcrR family transcriptional regulator